MANTGLPVALEVPPTSPNGLLSKVFAPVNTGNQRNNSISVLPQQLSQQHFPQMSYSDQQLSACSMPAKMRGQPLYFVDSPRERCQSYPSQQTHIAQAECYGQPIFAPPYAGDIKGQYGEVTCDSKAGGVQSYSQLVEEAQYRIRNQIMQSHQRLQEKHMQEQQYQQLHRLHTKQMKQDSQECRLQATDKHQPQFYQARAPTGGSVYQVNPHPHPL